MSFSGHWSHTTRELAPPLAPSRAMRGPLVRPPQAPWGGRTNESAFGEICRWLGGEPEEGRLYRVAFVTYPEFEGAPFIGEFVRVSLLNLLDDKERAIEQELILEFIVVAPPLAPGVVNGSRAEPLMISPTELVHLSLAQPGDLDPPPLAAAGATPLPGSGRVQ